MLRESFRAASQPQDLDRIRSRLIKALVRSVELAPAESELERFPHDEALGDEKLCSPPKFISTDATRGRRWSAPSASGIRPAPR